MAEKRQPTILETGVIVTQGDVDASNAKGTFVPPGGSTAERPANPKPLATRRNDTTGRTEVFDPATAQWQDVVLAKDLVELRAKSSVQAVSVAVQTPLALNGLQTVDGIVLSQGERVLVAGQASPAANGIYVASVGVWQRAADFNSTFNIYPGATIPVMRGARNKGALFMLDNFVAIETVGVTPLTFSFVQTKLINKIASSRAIAMALALS